MNIKRLFVRHGKPKFRATSAVSPNPGRILDIGLANDSYLECKAVFPASVYHGLDYHPISFKMAEGDKFLHCNLDDVISLENIPHGYDLIIINHVLEHLRDGEKVFSRLCASLAPGGVLYAEFPSLRTAYQRKTRLSYHFHDDPTHLRLYKLEDLANIALDSGCKIVSCGPISTPLKDFTALPRALVGCFSGAGFGTFMLHALRKIDHMMVRRPAA